MDGPACIGQLRTRNVAGFGPVSAGVIKERLVRFDPCAGSLSYEAAGGMPRFIMRAASRWSANASAEALFPG